MLQMASIRTPSRRVTVVGIDRRKVGEPFTAVLDAATVGVQQADAQGLSHAGAPVIGAGITAADQDALGPSVQGRAYQFAHAPGRGLHRIAGIQRHQAQTGSLGHLNHCGARAVAAEEAETGLDRMANRAGHGQLASISAGGHRHGLGETLAAVDQRQGLDRCVGRGAADPGRDRLGHPIGLQTLLVARGGDEHAQGHWASLE